MERGSAVTAAQSNRPSALHATGRTHPMPGFSISVVVLTFLRAIEMAFDADDSLGSSAMVSTPLVTAYNFGMIESADKPERLGLGWLWWLPVALVLYVLSVGPAAGLYEHDVISFEAYLTLWETIYRPLLWLNNSSHVAKEWIDWYESFF